MNKINYEERAKVYADALATFGATAPLMKALEELTEVQLEICRALDNRIHPAALAEEVADAAIMLEQVQQIFSIGPIVRKTMDAKVARLQNRVESAKRKTNDPEHLRRIWEFFGEGGGGNG